MALNGDTLGMAIATAVLDPNATPEGKAMCETFWKKIANCITDHIKNNAEVPAGISVTISGSATSQQRQKGQTTTAGSVI